MTSKNDKIRILEVPSELGAGTRGASLGIGAMKVAALISGNNYFSKYKSTIVPNENELLFESSPTMYANYIDGIVKVYNYVSHFVSEEVTFNKRFPIILAGDHSTAGATITGIKKSNPDYEVLSKEEIRKKAVEGAQGAFSPKSILPLSLLGLILMSALNSIFITIIFRRVVFRPRKQ